MKVANDELKKLIKVLDKLESDTCEVLTGISKISDGFAQTEMFNYDKEYFDIELKWGVQSDCQNTVHTEQYKVNRKTFEIEN